MLQNWLNVLLSSKGNVMAKQPYHPLGRRQSPFTCLKAIFIIASIFLFPLYTSTFLGNGKTRSLFFSSSSVYSTLTNKTKNNFKDNSNHNAIPTSTTNTSSHNQRRHAHVVLVENRDLETKKTNYGYYTLAMWHGYC